MVERVFAGVVGRGSGDRLPIRRLDLTESKVRELILELQPRDNNKVSGAKNEIDAVKTEVKTPE